MSAFTPAQEARLDEIASTLARIASNTDAIVELLSRCASGDYLSVTGDSAAQIYTPPLNPEASDRD